MTSRTNHRWLLLLLTFQLKSICIITGWVSPDATNNPKKSSTRNFQASTASSSASVPAGRVEDIDQWIQWCSDSLKKARGVSLLDYIHVDCIADVHSHERYAVVSHGTQDDPIFCYANAATLATFQYSEEEFYQLPSRKSAPTVGGERNNRQKIMKDVDNNQVWDIPSGIRQRKDGSLFEFRDVILWNVYTDKGQRVGQCAVYDRALIKEVDCIPPDKGSMNEL
jgi:hypothetical protein